MPKPTLNVLVLSDFAGDDANVIRDYLYCFNKHSKHRFFYLHHWRQNYCRRLTNFDFNRFDAIILFWDYFWIGSGAPLNYCYVPAWVSKRIAASSALKIQFLQDEYRDVRAVNEAMSRFAVNLMFTCVAATDQELFYPKRLIPSLQATYSVLTGYVPVYLENVNYPAAIDRPIDIGYRSRKLAHYLGSLGREKSIIAERFQSIADRYGFSADISVREQDRIYGEKWLTFMKSCRFSLGTESGASVVDFDGTTRQRCQEYMIHNPTATFEEVKAKVFADIDGKVVIQTISPRVFEASAFENTLIMHEGHYEGMLQPDVHYISVKKDYSNVQDVVERMRDRAFCESLAKNAKEKLIGSRNYNYESFVRRFDKILETHLPTPVRTGSVSRTIFYFFNYLNNDPFIPSGDKFQAVPHPRNIGGYRHAKSAPCVLTQFHGLNLVLSFLSQSSKLRWKFLQMIYDQRHEPMSLVGLLKDIRILAILCLHRCNKSDQKAFDLHLTYQAETKRLVVRSTPLAKNQSRETPSCSPRMLQERQLIDYLSSNGSSVSVNWDHRSIGNALPLLLTDLNTHCICLDDDCIWYFPTFNKIADALDANIMKFVFFGAWKDSSCWAKTLVFIQLAWIFFMIFAILKPSGVVKKWVSSVMAGASQSQGNETANAKACNK